jgi:hypothetical protein
MRSVETQLRRILRANARYYNERYRSGFDLPDLLSGRPSRSGNEAIWKIRRSRPGPFSLRTNIALVEIPTKASTKSGKRKKIILIIHPYVFDITQK